MPTLLPLFLFLRLAQQVVETALARLNRRHALDPARLAEAGRALGIGEDEMAKAVAYSGDRHRFGLVYGWVEVVVALAFLAAGGLGVVEAGARGIAGTLGLGTIATGLAFFAILGTLSALFELPFDLYATFRIEERHGFNRQTLGGFFLDRLKGVGIAVALGGPVLAAVLWLMERMGPSWWLWAWGVTTAFSLFAAWIYPTVLAPLFNKFTPLPDGELQGRDPGPRPPHGLPGGRHLGHGRLAPHRPRQRLLHRPLRPEADRPLRHPRSRRWARARWWRCWPTSSATSSCTTCGGEWRAASRRAASSSSR